MKAYYLCLREVQAVSFMYVPGKIYMFKQTVGWAEEYFKKLDRLELFVRIGRGQEVLEVATLL